MTTKYRVHWLQVGESKVPIAIDAAERRVLIRLFAQGMGLVTDRQRRLLREYADVWEIRGVQVRGASTLRNEPSLPVNRFDAYLWHVNNPLNEGAKRRLDEVRLGWRKAFISQFAPAVPDSPSALEIAAAVHEATAGREREISALKAEVARLQAQIDGKPGLPPVNPTHRVKKGATRPLGPKEFTEIRDPQSAGVSDEDMARRLMMSPISVRQVREGTYPSVAFVNWLEAQGLAPKTVFNPNRRVVLREWKPVAPDWVLVLALACDDASQTLVARRLGVSTALVNQVLQRKYKGRYDRIEQRVREELV